MKDGIEVIILAAGLGTRMKSTTVKVLHRAAGRPLIDYVVDLAKQISDKPPVVIVGHQREAVQKWLGDRARYAVQEEQLGTGHAVLQAAKILGKSGPRNILILSGDVPLTRAETLKGLIEEHERSRNALTLLTMTLPDPAMYGRIVRDSSGGVVKIVEAKDAGDTEKKIGEVNAGIYVFAREPLFENLDKLSSDNAQGEYYLTDLLGMLRKSGQRVGAMIVDDPVEAIGVNSRAELATVEEIIQRRVVEKLMRDGVTFRNPATVVIDSMVAIGADTVVYPFVTLEGTTKVGRDCVIEPGVHLHNVTVGNNVHLKSGSVAEDAIIEDEATIGPYAHLRPGTQLGKHVRVGNFVETKKAIFGQGAKASHLSYIGDAEIGADVNIGAGTITCNYGLDRKKHRTTIGDGAYIGSDSMLVAPVRIGRGAITGAGAVVTKDVPPRSVVVGVPARVIRVLDGKR